MTFDCTSADLERNRTKFLASNKGHMITLSENDLVATKDGFLDTWTNYFVAMKRPVQGKVVLTLLNFASNFFTFIGFFDPSYLQASNYYSHAHSLNLCHGHTQFYVNYPNTSGPSNPGAISKGQQVVIEFNNNQATFSVPSVGYSHTVSWPIGYVFGLVLQTQNSSRKLSSS
ncbi:hypothetical protein RCL1_008197 [Eukaryota sp. TZLM3-RCL]